MDRASKFSDPRVIKSLQQDFIPVTGDTHEIQNGKSPARNWFMQMAQSVNPRILSGQTAQGHYVAGADGAGSGFNNNRDVERLLQLLKTGQEKFAQNPPARVTVAANELGSDFTRLAPVGSSILRIFVRIHPLPAGCNELNKGAARDHLWVLPQEVRAMAEAPGSGEFALPPTLIARLARYHLTDFVRGEPNFWRGSEVKRARFEGTLLQKTAETVEIRFMGDYAMQTGNGQRGLDGKMEGAFTLDRASAKIRKFRAFAEGHAWGAGTYTPSPPPGKFPLLFALQETNDAFSKIVPPQGALDGPDYLQGVL
ncbi:hypothetical protein [Armatimonas sp.]|uniref:hypothetical protein n=1 Tax=Armatimonas sp. TaxID=1872638 RepID=UPI003753651E